MKKIIEAMEKELKEEAFEVVWLKELKPIKPIEMPLKKYDSIFERMNSNTLKVGDKEMTEEEIYNALKHFSK